MELSALKTCYLLSCAQDDREDEYFAKAIKQETQELLNLGLIRFEEEEPNFLEHEPIITEAGLAVIAALPHAETHEEGDY